MEFVFRFSLQRFKIFLNLRRTERDVILSVCRSFYRVLEYPLFLSHRNQTWVCVTFEVNTEMSNFHVCGRTGVQIDMTDLIFACRTFANVSENCVSSDSIGRADVLTLMSLR
jgi:hypothetical protein